MLSAQTPNGLVTKNATDIFITNNAYGLTGVQSLKEIAKGSYTTMKVEVSNCYTSTATYFVGRCMTKFINNYREISENIYTSVDLIKPNNSITQDRIYSMPIVGNHFYPLFTIYTTSSGSYNGNVTIKKIWLEQ